MAIFAVSVGSSELALVEHASITAESSLCSSLLPDCADAFASQEMSHNSSSSPSSNPLALSVKSLALSVHGASLTLSVEGLQWFSMLWVRSSFG